jgi:hypothetical protein
LISVGLRREVIEPKSTALDEVERFAPMAGLRLLVEMPCRCGSVIRRNPLSGYAVDIGSRLQTLTADPLSTVLAADFISITYKAPAAMNPTNQA